MADKITIYRGTTGLNTVSDPVRIGFDAEASLSDLAVAVNIDIDQSYRVTRRKGFELLHSGAYHSLFCDTGECLVISGTTMYTVSKDFSTLKTVVSGLVPNFRMSYAQHGSKIYFNNTYNRGYIDDSVFTQLTAGEYLGPDTNRIYGIPEGGSHIGIFFGRMLMAVGNMVFWSEPWQFNVYDLANSHITLDSRVRMIKPVDDGVWISSSKLTYFLSGNDPKKWKLITRAQFPALEWSVATKLVDGYEIGLQNPGLCALWTSPEGAILGTGNGQLINLTKSKVIYPEDVSMGASCLIGYNFLHRMV